MKAPLNRGDMPNMRASANADVTDEQIDFWSNVDIGTVRRCWDWKGQCASATAGGRGIYRRSRGCWYSAARLAFELAYGVDPGDWQVLHACDNPLCCNPRHLRLGDRRDNCADVSVNRFMARVADAIAESKARAA